MARRCSRPGCKQDAVYTLTYVYRDSTAVVGPLAAYTEPHCYDLCEGHAGRLTAPLGWDVVRLPVHVEEQVPASAGEVASIQLYAKGSYLSIYSLESTLVTRILPQEWPHTSGNGNSRWRLSRDDWPTIKPI